MNETWRRSSPVVSLDIMRTLKNAFGSLKEAEDAYADVMRPQPAPPPVADMASSAAARRRGWKPGRRIRS